MVLTTNESQVTMETLMPNTAPQTKRHPLIRQARAAVRITLATFLCSLLTPLGWADDVAYRQAMASAVRAAANQVLPSIVTVEIIGTGGAKRGEVEQDAPTSGVVIDRSGYILASNIVVRRPSASLLVLLPDGSRHAAKVVARDHHRDLVLLKIASNQDLVPIDLASDAELRIGQTTVAVGRYGSDASPAVSRGVLSATERLDGIALQTDARVSPAFYGGPLIDLYGNVLGILIPAVAQGGAADATSWYDSGIAFAIPSDVIADKIDRLKSGEDVKKGLIGIVSKSKDPYEDETAIAAVRARSPASSAGIKAGDKVLTVDGKPVRRHQEIRQILGRFDAGEAIRLKLQRDGREIELEITLADNIPPLQPQRLGVVTRERTLPSQKGDDKEDQEQTEVMVDSVLPRSAADGLLEPGDVITRVGDAAIADAESLRRQMISAEPDKPIRVAYRRDGEEGETEIIPDSIAGEIFKSVPDAWKEPAGDEWTSQPIKLPEAGNAAAYVAPKPDTETDQLGLLVLLLNPGQGSPEKVLESWPDLARQTGVVVCAIAPENTRRWQPKEIEVVANFAAAIMKKAPIDRSAVAVAASGGLAGGSAEASDAMALAVAISQSNSFFGVAISPKTRPPALRLRENEPAASLQVLLPVESTEDLPTWSAGFERGGYPIVRGGALDGITLLRWVRLLQAI
jgi:S1-C subfamily serine protease